MKIIYRYLAMEFIPPFFYGFFLITFIILMNLIVQMLGRIAGKGLDPYVVTEYFFLNLAWIVALAVPMAVLVATLSAFGRLSAENEFTAMKAAGLSLWQLIVPFILLSGLLCYGLIEFNNRVLPDFNHRTRVLSGDISRKRPTLALEAGTFVFDLPKYVLWAKHIDQKGSKLKSLVIYDRSDPQHPTIVSAQHGDLKFVHEDEAFHLKLFNGEIHRQDTKDPGYYQRTKFEKSMVRIPAPNMVFERHDSDYRSDRELSALEMWQQVQVMKNDDPVKNKRKINSYMVEVHKKYSIPIACLVFVLIGAPLGVRVHRGGLGVAAGLSVLFFLVYWAFLIGGEDLADRSFITPAMAMWAPNIVMGILGFFLIRSTIREAKIIDFGAFFRKFKKNQ